MATATGGSGGSGGDLIQVPPSRVTNAGTTFYSESHNTLNDMTDFNTMTQQAMADMFLIAELAKFASALQNYQARMIISMNCLLEAQVSTGLNLQGFADDMVTLDAALQKLFQLPNGQLPSLIHLPGTTYQPWQVPQPQTPLIPSIPFFPGFEGNPVPTPTFPGGFQIPPIYAGPGTTPPLIPGLSGNWWSSSSSPFLQGSGTPPRLPGSSFSSPYTSALTDPHAFGLNENIWSLYQLNLP